MDYALGCPVGGCDYRGTPASVIAHITGKRDSAHKGEHGSTYAEELYTEAYSNDATYLVNAD